jgi:5-formyltetrahydrofolate cyclo-ligase
MNERRLALAPADVTAGSTEICRRLLILIEAAAAERVALFGAIRNEVDLVTLADALRRGGRKTFYPRVDPPAGLSFHEVTDTAALCPTGRYAIPEPAASAPRIDPVELDVVVVPGLAFDGRGHRLGWGAGYYDALLPRAKRARRVGVCFDFQLVEICPSVDQDQRVHVIVTDRRQLAAVDQEGVP